MRSDPHNLLKSGATAVARSDGVGGHTVAVLAGSDGRVRAAHGLAGGIGTVDVAEQQPSPWLVQTMA